mmetsp:Transcript_6305/g.9062  ORF Transcript_6305/g.9062 Transcript_6305/m.9062 type:complete len:204 (+) Transcript_6305:212-823(+)
MDVGIVEHVVWSMWSCRGYKYKWRKVRVRWRVMKRWRYFLQFCTRLIREIVVPCYSVAKIQMPPHLHLNKMQMQMFIPNIAVDKVRVDHPLVVVEALILPAVILVLTLRMNFMEMDPCNWYCHQHHHKRPREEKSGIMNLDQGVPFRTRTNTRTIITWRIFLRPLCKITIIQLRARGLVPVRVRVLVLPFNLYPQVPPPVHPS